MAEYPLWNPQPSHRWSWGSLSYLLFLVCTSLALENACKWGQVIRDRLWGHDTVPRIHIWRNNVRYLLNKFTCLFSDFTMIISVNLILKRPYFPFLLLSLLFPPSLPPPFLPFIYLYTCVICVFLCLCVCHLWVFLCVCVCVCMLGTASEKRSCTIELHAEPKEL